MDSSGGSVSAQSDDIEDNPGNATFKCHFCNIVKGGTYRVRAHLLKIPGKGASACEKVSIDDIAKVKKMDDTAEAKREVSKPKVPLFPNEFSSSTDVSSREPHIQIADVGDSILAKDSTQSEILVLHKLTRCQWWLLVGLNVFFLVAGQTAAVLLGRFYYDQGGSSTFMATLVQTAGFPILFIPLLFLPSSSSSSTPSGALSGKYICLIYIALGLVLASDNFLYSKGLLYLSASTYSLICATQLAFNAVFAFFINSQKFTPLILNAVVILSYSAALLGVNESSDAPEGVTRSQYVVGFLCTLGASAIYSLLLSLMQLTFEKALKKETFSVVLEMQIYTSIVATLASIVGLFASGQWNTLSGEMHSFHSGKVSYVMTLVWTAVCWQMCSVGVVGLIFLVSSLFSNVISTVALAVGPVASVIAFHDKMNGVKIIAMLQALWGFASYIYQNYIDERRTTQLRGQMEPTDI